MTLSKEYLQTLLEYREGELYWKDSRGRIKIGTAAGTVNSAGYKITTIDSKKVLNHRIIFVMHNGYWPDYVDHINGDKLDNRIENLRACTQSENMYNQGINRCNTSGTKHVRWNKHRSKWAVHMRISGRSTYLGLYEDRELAELVALEARNKYHGEFARAA